MVNKRRHVRVKARDVAGHVRSPDRSIACTIENISVGGAFVRTHVPVALGSQVMVDIVKPGLKRAVRVSARVIHVVTMADAAKQGRAAGMAVKFDPLPEETETRLLLLLRELGLYQKPLARGDGVENEISEPVTVSESAQLMARVRSLMDELADRDQQIAKLRAEVKRLRALFRATSR